MHIRLRPARGNNALISRKLLVFASKLVRNTGQSFEKTGRSYPESKTGGGLFEDAGQVGGGGIECEDQDQSDIGGVEEDVGRGAGEEERFTSKGA